MRKTQYPTVEYLRQCFRIEDGKLFWLERPLEHFKNHHGWNVFHSTYPGKEAGILQRYGDGSRSKHESWRWTIGIKGILYLRYKIIWVMNGGGWEDRIDHKDNDPSNDRIENLRLCTESQNQANSRRRRNNTSGFKCVYWNKKDQKWAARIMVDRRSMRLGNHDTPELAHAAYVEAATRFHGEFANPG